MNYFLTRENRLFYNASREPSESLEDYNAAFLSVAELDVRATIDAFQSDDFQFEDTSTRLIGTCLSRDLLELYDSEPNDRMDEELLEDRTKELEMLASNLERLRIALLELCANTKSPHASVTMLAHLGLSQRMILIDDDSTPDPELDWENIQLSPLDFMDSAEEPYAPEPDDHNKERNARHLNNYRCTLCRQLYRKTLTLRDSPLSKAVLEDMPNFDRELLELLCSF